MRTSSRPPGQQLPPPLLEPSVRTEIGTFNSTFVLGPEPLFTPSTQSDSVPSDAYVAVICLQLVTLGMLLFCNWLSPVVPDDDTVIVVAFPCVVSSYPAASFQFSFEEIIRPKLGFCEIAQQESVSVLPSPSVVQSALFAYSKYPLLLSHMAPPPMRVGYVVLFRYSTVPEDVAERLWTDSLFESEKCQTAL